MDYKLLSKEQGTGYKSWVENLEILFEDYGIDLPSNEQLRADYHEGLTVWDVFRKYKVIKYSA